MCNLFVEIVYILAAVCIFSVFHTIRTSRDNTLKSDFFRLYLWFLATLVAYLLSLVGQHLSRHLSTVVPFKVAQFVAVATLLECGAYQVTFIVMRYWVAVTATIQSFPKPRRVLLIAVGVNLFGLAASMVFLLAEVEYDEVWKEILGYSENVEMFKNFAIGIVYFVALMIALPVNVLVIRFVRSRNLAIEGLIVFCCVQMISMAAVLTYAIVNVTALLLHSRYWADVGRKVQFTAGLVSLAITLAILLCSTAVRDEVRRRLVRIKTMFTGRRDPIPAPV